MQGPAKWNDGELLDIEPIHEIEGELKQNIPGVLAFNKYDTKVLRQYDLRIALQPLTPLILTHKSLREHFVPPTRAVTICPLEALIHQDVCIQTYGVKNQKPPLVFSEAV
jgi:hypothetical protein